MKIVKLTTIIFIVSALSLLSFSQVLAQDEKCNNDWYGNFSLELRPGFWSPGEHQYTYGYTLDGVNYETDPIDFYVDNSVPIYDGQILLRVFGLVTYPRWTILDEINPSQDTVFQLSFIFFDMSQKEARKELSRITASLSWDGGDWIDLSAGPLMNGCAWNKDSVLFHRHWGPPY